MFPNTDTTTTENPIASWVVSDEPYPKGTTHPTNTPERLNRLTWRVLLQVVATHLREYEREHDTKEKEQWQIRINNTIQEVNQLNTPPQWGLEETPIHPTPDYLVPVAGGSWLECMTTRLNVLFGNASPVVILRTE